MPDKSSSGVDIASKDPAHDPLHGVPSSMSRSSEPTITDSQAPPMLEVRCRSASQSFAPNSPRSTLSNPLKGHPYSAPGQSDSAPDLAVRDALGSQRHDQTISLVGTHLTRTRRPLAQEPRLQLSVSADLIRAALTHAFSVKRRRSL
jgi:hypothetical protein